MTDQFTILCTIAGRNIAEGPNGDMEPLYYQPALGKGFIQSPFWDAADEQEWIEFFEEQGL